MSKTLIGVVGLVVSLGVIALGFFLVAVPLYLQAIGIDAQTNSVAIANVNYQAQVDLLSEQEEDLDQIASSVAGLRAQIPATGQLDDVFEVIARAAETSQVAITSVTAGEQVAFVERMSPEEAAEAAVAPAPAPEATPSGAEDPSVVDSAGTDGANGADVAAPGRQQVDFAINVTAVNMDQVTAFLDALRGGPRLLESLKVISVTSGDGNVDVQVSALTFVDTEG